jgi:prepilin signal peptidase PulO-like enzyme (type II secretory pathway)
LVEALTGLLFVVVALTATNWFLLLLLAAVVSILVVIAVYDLYHFIIPDEFVVLLSVLALLYQGYALLGVGSPGDFFTSLGVAFLGSLFLFFLWYGSDGKWIGFGDVKLAFPLGLLAGSASVFSMVVLSFWSGAIIGLLLLLVQYIKRRGQKHLRFVPARFTMKSAVPFAPFLILGFLQVFFFGTDVIALLSYAY